MPCSAQFAVIGPPEPILALVGEVAELPCHLSPKMSAESMDLMWVRSGFRQAVCAYADGKEETEIAEYRGRTLISREDIAEGKAALRIHNIRASDSGTYQCYFQDANFLAKAQVELKVAGWRNLQYLAKGDRAQAYAEWKMALYQPADVILDPDTAHPNLLISEDQRSLQYTYTWQSLPDNPRRFQDHYCVLGRESFKSGRHFWEVEVGGRKQWQFGVCRENVERKRYPSITPQNGFWTIALLGGHDFHARTDPRSQLTIVNPLKRVGVFLDYENGEVSFYDAINGVHIFTFPQASFSGPLWPLFRIFSQEPTALTICPALKGSGSSPVSDPLPGPSLETPEPSGSTDGNGDPQAELQLFLPPAQP
ncbi:butyrophilin subfamily 3 member A3-like [Eptesicus fuscus]|uniref:butyrophilin subfamily 3 member A3-like n=1 Tax=Eptesicus fuscus TaxID=29078 RepID=UPI0024040AFF|nr:butyrophilin subfamily 3 member A3-like [Eptesicus fuscus]